MEPNNLLPLKNSTFVIFVSVADASALMEMLLPSKIPLLLPGEVILTFGASLGTAIVLPEVFIKTTDEYGARVISPEYVWFLAST